MANRVALVTGGNGGIGTEICRQLSQAGYKVVTTCMDAEKENIAGWQEEMKAKGCEIGYVQGNVADFDSCKAMAQEVEEKFGPVDVLVNVAGITRDAMLHKMDPANWNAVISVNLNSVFNMSQQVIEGMRGRGFGRIINISSVNGQTGQFGQTNYSAAKAGMHGFTMALAKEGARKNVTVNTISPGYIETSMTAAIKQEVLDSIIATIPAGKMGQPSDIARTVVFLAADDAGYITGANIPVNGALFTSF